MTQKPWGRAMVTLVIVFIMLLVLAPVVSALARWFYRRELVDFTLGTSGYPVVGPMIGAMGFGLSALGGLFALNAEDQGSKQTMSSEWTMISFLFSLLGLLALSSLALWRIFENA